MNDKEKHSLEEAEKIREQLKSLSIKETETLTHNRHKPNGQEAARGLAASMHIVSGVMVGGFLGYGFDYIFNTLPFGTAIMIPVGMIAGFRNMICSLDNESDNKDKEHKIEKK